MFINAVVVIVVVVVVVVVVVAVVIVVAVVVLVLVILLALFNVQLTLDPSQPVGRRKFLRKTRQENKISRELNMIYICGSSSRKWICGDFKYVSLVVLP